MTKVIEVRAPVENVNDETIAIIRWLVDQGAFVERDTPLVMAETSKTVFDVPAPASGFVWQVAEASTDIPTGGLLCYMGEPLEAVQAHAGVRPVPAEMPVPAAGDERQPLFDSTPVAGASPTSDGALAANPSAPRFSAKASQLVQQLGLNPEVFSGRGLVREQDVVAYRDQQAGGYPAPAPSLEGVEGRPETYPGIAGVPTRTEKLSRMKRTEIRQLRSSWSSVLPSLASVAVPSRGFLTANALRPDVALGLASSAIIFEAGRLLRHYPMFNAFCAGDEASYYEEVNIGYAVDLGKGLKVPVIRDADRKSLNEIAAEKQQLLVDYINDALPVQSLAGATFTISDLSSEGVLHFQPMVNQRQSAILGVCAEVPTADTAAGAYSLVLAFDHQLGDGRTAATFLRDLRDRLVAHEASLRHSADTQAAAAEPHCAVCLRPAGELERNRHFLVRTVGPAAAADQAVCTICLQDW